MTAPAVDRSDPGPRARHGPRVSGAGRRARGRRSRSGPHRGDSARRGRSRQDRETSSSASKFRAPRRKCRSRSRRSRARRRRSRTRRRTRYARHDLFDRGVAARKEVEDADRAVADAQAALAQAEAARAAANLVAARSVVRATFDGVVAKRYHNPGDLVEPVSADPVLRVIDPRRLEVVASVPLADSRAHRRRRGRPPRERRRPATRKSA